MVSCTRAAKRKQRVLGAILKEAVIHTDRESTHVTLRSSGIYIFIYNYIYKFINFLIKERALANK